jgi:acetyl esterase
VIDPELAAFVDLIPAFDLNDPVAARTAFEELIAGIHIELPEAEAVDVEDRRIAGWEGDPDVPVRVYRPKRAHGDGAAPVPGIVFIHGGGFIIGSVEAEHIGAVLVAADTGAVVVSVDYRLAPEHPYPAALHDCYAALSWLHAEADALGVDRDRVAVMGASAGGGLSAAVALLARDLGGPALCFQMLQIPELDDRLETSSMQKFVDSPLWNRPLAVQSWKAYLGELYGSPDVPAHAAPSRANDLSGLPPAYISTAELDPLRDEGIVYALGLLHAGVSVELHQFPGTFHGSALVTTAAVSKRVQHEAALVVRRALGVET